MSQPRASPIRMAYSMARSFGTGSVPGCPRHTSHTCVFGGAPNSFGHPQNILVAVESSTWHSRPMTVSRSVMAYGTIPALGSPPAGDASSQDLEQPPVLRHALQGAEALVGEGEPGPADQ